MSPRTRTPRQPKPTIWREAPSLMVHERAKHHARRHSLTLHVIVNRRAAVGSLDTVTATVTRVVQPEGRHEQIAQMEWSVDRHNDRLRDAQVDVAKQWAENEADRIDAAANGGPRG